MSANISNEERFNQLMSISGDWVWEMDNKGLFTYTNGGVTRILGYEPNEVIGKSYKDFIRNSKMIEEGVNYSKEVHTHIHKDGTDRIMESTKLKILGTDGILSGYRGIDHDITERVNNAKKIAEQYFEIEKMNKFMVDRELKMVELKNEISKLKEQLNKDLQK